MTDAPKLSPERRAAMRGWVLDYVDRRKRFRRRLTIVGGAVIGVTALSAAAWVVLVPQEVQQRQVVCFDAPSLDAHQAGGQRFSGDEVGDVAAYAVEMCSQLWQSGVIGQGDTPPPTSGTASFPVPHLTLCVRADQSLAVFPTSDPSFCKSIDLALYRDPR
jgi:hypothetical protein